MQLLAISHSFVSFETMSAMSDQHFPLKDWERTFYAQAQRYIYHSRLFPEERVNEIVISNLYNDAEWQRSCAEQDYGTWRFWHGQVFPYCRACEKFFDMSHIAGKKHIKAMHYWECNMAICAPCVPAKRPKKEEPAPLTAHQVLQWFSHCEDADALWVLSELDQSKYKELFFVDKH